MEVTAQAFLRVAKWNIKFFFDRIRMLLMSSGQIPFVQVANRWNTQLVGLLTYFREAVISTGVTSFVVRILIVYSICATFVSRNECRFYAFLLVLSHSKSISAFT